MRVFSFTFLMFYGNVWRAKFFMLKLVETGVAAAFIVVQIIQGILGAFILLAFIGCVQYFNEVQANSAFYVVMGALGFLSVWELVGPLLVTGKRLLSSALINWLGLLACLIWLAITGLIIFGMISPNGIKTEKAWQAYFIWSFAFAALIINLPLFILHVAFCFRKIRHACEQACNRKEEEHQTNTIVGKLTPS